MISGRTHSDCSTSAKAFLDAQREAALTGVSHDLSGAMRAKTDRTGLILRLEDATTTELKMIADYVLSARWA